MGLRDRVRAEVEALHDRARGTRIGALRDGSWLVPVVREALDPYSAQTDRYTLAVDHGVSGADDLADACISWAQRRALVAGGLSAGTYASVVVAALATGGAASAVALPTAVAAFTVDLWYTARVQLQLAWDLAVIYEVPFDLADDTQVVELCRLAFGVDTAAAAATVLAGLAPEASRFGTRALTTAARLAHNSALRVMGQRLVQRGLARFAVPAIGVPLCAAVNHVTTGRTGRAAQLLLRSRARGRALADELEDELEHAPVRILEALLWIVEADERARGAEVALLEGLTEGLEQEPLQAALGREPEAWLADLSGLGAPVREAVYDAAIEAAALDGVLHVEEDRRLRLLAEACGVPFDPAAVARAVVAARG